MAEYSLSRFNSYSEYENSITKNVFYKISFKISNNYKNYDYTFMIGKLLSLIVLQYQLILLIAYQPSNTDTLLTNFINANPQTIILYELLFIIIISIFGNILPNIIARNNIIRISLLVSPIIIICYYVFYPLIFVSSISYQIFNNFFGLEKYSDENEQNIQDEIKYLIEESSKLGELDKAELDIIENALDFSETIVKKIMTPRNKIISIDIDEQLSEIINLISEEGYSRYPVYQDSIDNVVGILNVKDFLKNYIKDPNINIKEIIRKPVLVNEDETIDNLLKVMKSQKVHLVIAKDIFNGTSGIITMEDILEEIVGEINDEYDEEQKLCEKISDTEYKINPIVNIDDLNKLLPYPLQDSNDYESLGGYILYLTGAIPHNNQIIDDQYYTFTILKSTKRKIELVKLEVKATDQ